MTNKLYDNLELHGYPVIAIAAMPDAPATRPNLRVILVDRGTEYAHDRYVVSLWCVGDKEWMSGSYFNSYHDAIGEFARKCNINYWAPPPIEKVPVPIVCCQLFALCLMTGRPPAHAVGCPNRRP